MATKPAQLTTINNDVPDDVDAVARDLVAAGVTPEKLYVELRSVTNANTGNGIHCGKLPYVGFTEPKAAAFAKKAGEFVGILKTQNASFAGERIRWRFEVSDAALAPEPAPSPTVASGLEGLKTTAANSMPEYLLTMMMQQQAAMNQQALAQQQRSHETTMEMLRSQRQTPQTGFGDKIMELLFAKALDKSPASDAIALMDALDKRRKPAEGETGDEPDAEPSMVGMVLKAITALATASSAQPAPHAQAAQPATVDRRPAPQLAGATDAASPVIAFTPTPEPAGEPAAKVDPKTLDEMDRVVLFGRRVVPALLDAATDPSPDVDAAAMMVASIAKRCGLDPAKWKDTDAADIIDPAIAICAELAPHREFCVKAIDAMKAALIEDDEDDAEPDEPDAKK